MAKPTFGSLFAGIGGLDLGLERAGWKCEWQVEIDPFCRDVLTNHWPDVPKYGDIHDVGTHNLTPVDLVCGGFPCQPISRTGRREAQDDSRWLWPEFARLLDELRPNYVVLENTDGLPHRGLGSVLSDLASLGYDAEWESISAAHFGAPHVRGRVFLVAYANPNGRDIQILPEGRPVSDEERDHALSTTRWQDFQRRVGGPVPRSPGSRTCRGDDGVPFRLERTKALGNAVVPQVAEWLGRCILQAEGAAS